MTEATKADRGALGLKLVTIGELGLSVAAEPLWNAFHNGSAATGNPSSTLRPYNEAVILHGVRIGSD